MDLTRDELAFLASQGLTESDVLDGRRMSKEQIRLVAKDRGKAVVLGATCAKGGHRLRTRSGHCVQCDTKKLGYQTRHRKASDVYIAFSRSAGLTKVGSSTDYNTRINKLNFDGVGGARDWRLLFRIAAEEGGRLEVEAQVLLAGYLAPTTYVKDGRQQDSRECFTCLPARAMEAILHAAERGRHALGAVWKTPAWPA